MEPKNLTRFGPVIVYNAEAKLFLEQFFVNTTDRNMTFGDLMLSPVLEGHVTWAAQSLFGMFGFLTNSQIGYF